MTRSYEKYKSIENYGYIDSIPSEWELLPNIAIFDERISKGHIDEELISVTIGRGIIKQSDIGNKKDNSNEDKSNYKLVEVGDIAYNKMRMWQGSVGYSQYRGIVSPAYVVLKPKREINPKYYHYLFRTKYYNNYVKRFSYGLCDDQLNLRYSDFKRMYSIVPPLVTQNKIVDYLEKKEHQCIQFINKQKQLIELLKEEKKLIINEAITKGLYKNVKMKYSENKLIGEIPESWNVVKLRYLTNKITDGSHSSPESFTDGYPYVTVTDIRDGNIDLINCKKIKYKDFIQLKKNGCKPSVGDILLTKDGTIGRAAIVKSDEEFVVLSSLAIITPNKNINVNYLADYLTSGICIDEMKSNIQGSALTRLTISLIKDLNIVVPSSIQEQIEISEHIKNQTIEINKAIIYAENQIRLINDYLESLIFSIVTGKKKVD